MNARFTEQELEQAIINLFEQEDYIYENGENIHRLFEDILLVDDLKKYLLKKYDKENLTENEIETIINSIKLVPSHPLYDGNKEVYRLINSGFSIARDDSALQNLHVSLIDFNDLDNNIYKVVNQYSVQGSVLRRPDLIVFINGIPVCICEFKSAIREETTIVDAWKQINNRYKRDIPNLMKYCFLSMITDGANSKLGTIFTPYEYYYAWKKIDDGEAVSDGINSLITMIKGALSQERITEILNDFVYYPDSTDVDLAVVTRYPQYFATKKMFENIKQHIKPDGDGKGGTYFGATGCGKTYTMLFLARQLMLRDGEKFKNPTIVIITDRDDLDSQTSELFTTAKSYLHDENVRSIESRQDLRNALGATESGGVYVTTIQKFCEETGLLSLRNNIICISDEAHRSQTNTGSSVKVTEKGVHTTFGFAKYLRDSFPNATYVGFTGTPIEETITVFGRIVDSYTMKESCEDGITVSIAYEPRLARVILNEAQAREIENYYKQCTEEGSGIEQVETSKKAMSKIQRLLGHPERIKKLARDIVEHYETLCDEKPEIVQKAMIVCSDRKLAYKVLKAIIDLRPEWNEPKRSENESELPPEELHKLMPLEKIKLVATRDKDDEEELYNLLGTKEYRKTLDKQFKNVLSNFRIAIVVDMWITGFDVPSLAVMYIDKPIQKHTLIQTISRVNRVYAGKSQGLVVDYIGIKDDMLKALKQYGGNDGPVDNLEATLRIFRNYLNLIDRLMKDFDANDFYNGEPLDRLMCLNRAAEYVQISREFETRYMDLTKKMKAAYEICLPSGELTSEEIDRAQFYLATRSIVYKQTKGHAPDTEMMNRRVEKMVEDAISCTGVENIINAEEPEDLFGDKLTEQVDALKMPFSKYNALLKLLKKAISGYGRINKIKAIEFDKRLRDVIEKYNNRDKLVFTSDVVDDFVNDLSEELIKIMNELHKDKTSFEEMGISFEEKAFYDILVKVRDEHNFKYEDEKCITLAKKIKELVDEKSKYTDWSVREDIKNKLNMDLTVLLYKNGYPPEWDDEIFKRVMEQAENFKKHAAVEESDVSNIFKRKIKQINFQNAIQLLKVSDYFKSIIQSGAFKYVEGYFVINHDKYVIKDDNGQTVLTQYAKDNLAECVLTFNYDVNKFDNYNTPDTYYFEYGMVSKKLSYPPTTLNSSVVQLSERLVNIHSVATEVTEVRKTLTDSFSDTFKKLMKYRKLTVEKLSETSNVGSKTIQRLRNEEDYRPSLQTVIALCIGLQLPPALSYDLIKKSGYMLRNNDEHNVYELMINTCSDSSIHECNGFLRAHGYNLLGKDDE
ncbi:MAG: HsdR family type I site-specific deoxyribonuclease [Clostridia bacterium]|nr:HsdR family type I site-specific deoxyribonuclease [Clostridia bacterium]